MVCSGIMKALSKISELASELAKEKEIKIEEAIEMIVSNEEKLSKA